MVNKEVVVVVAASVVVKDKKEVGVVLAASVVVKDKKEVGVVLVEMTKKTPGAVVGHLVKRNLTKPRMPLWVLKSMGKFFLYTFNIVKIILLFIIYNLCGKVIF